MYPRAANSAATSSLARFSRSRCSRAISARLTVASTRARSTGCPAVCAATAAATTAVGAGCPAGRRVRPGAARVSRMAASSPDPLVAVPDFGGQGTQQEVPPAGRCGLDLLHDLVEERRCRTRGRPGWPSGRRRPRDPEPGAVRRRGRGPRSIAPGGGVRRPVGGRCEPDSACALSAT